MKKMKKSLKLIIIIASILLVAAAATILTIVLVKNNKKNEQNPEDAKFMLTAQQSLLVGEINNSLENAVSGTKFDSMKLGDDVAVFENATYVDKNTVWKRANPAVYTVDVFVDENKKRSDCS